MKYSQVEHTRECKKASQGDRRVTALSLESHGNERTVSPLESNCFLDALISNMSGAKPFRLPPCTPTPRSDLLPPTCGAIDVFLKQAKSHLRDAQAIFSSHQAEMVLLDRLYYKGKNQHHMSLFWQRVCEMRRYGRRLQDMNVTAMMENNRAMFYGVQAPVK